MIILEYVNTASAHTAVSHMNGGQLLRTHTRTRSHSPRSVHNEMGASTPHIHICVHRALSSARREISIIPFAILTKGHCHGLGLPHRTCIIRDPACILAHRFAAVPTLCINRAS
ncbi:hypothetical protein BGW80DRAFT_1286213 [Lactifluus volemus]|nr:hypothetical protein BGW80DRAFT_1396469 [Lactifluus volemus]KAH9971612.1 hypothetical protein BGW80DRAFT_1321393 [Lactifluus volemus]KAH9972232.1 hypothetical protein BGW80DRAFT_1315051 [Lactifluus volemus]KAH9978176.1 hypothetical protein BGW80DRAFT_1286213 [Lactifluus volemus]